MVNDPIADLIIQIKNASLANKRSIVLPYARVKYEVAKILCSEGYLVSAEKTGSDPKASLSISLKYVNGVSVLTGVKRISKPGLRWYVNKHNIPRVVGGMGIAILSTPSGIMTDKEARKRGIGGELLCEIW